MQSLIDFLSSYEPQYRAIARGYEADDIGRLEQALGRELPVFYRDFLTTAAANLGFLHDELDFDLDELVDFTEMKRSMLDRMMGQLVLVGVDDTISHSDYYVHLGRPVAHSPGDGELVRSASGGREFDDQHTGYDCFHDLLFSRGFMAVRMLRLRERTFLSWQLETGTDSTHLWQPLTRTLEALGFEIPVETGPRTTLYERGGEAAVVRCSASGGMVSVYLACDERRSMGQIAHTLLDQMPSEGLQQPVAPTSSELV